MDLLVTKQSKDLDYNFTTKKKPISNTVSFYVENDNNDKINVMCENFDFYYFFVENLRYALF